MSTSPVSFMLFHFHLLPVGSGRASPLGPENKPQHETEDKDLAGVRLAGTVGEDHLDDPGGASGPGQGLPE